jgi:drug/metabolite transporter (DMT)-like permease
MLSTFFALANLQASEVLTLTMTFPVWVAILSWPMLGEIPTKGVWIAVLISVLGVALAVYPGSSDVRPIRWLPIVSAVAASIFTALAMLGLNRLKAIPPMAVVVHFSAVATIFAVLSYFLFEMPIGPSGFETTASKLKLVGVGVTAMIGQVFLTLAFSGGSATKISVVGLSQVVMVMTFEAVCGWKSFTLLNLLGTVLILLPTGWLMIRERRESKIANEPLPIE